MLHHSIANASCNTSRGSYIHTNHIPLPINNHRVSLLLHLDKTSKYLDNLPYQLINRLTRKLVDLVSKEGGEGEGEGDGGDLQKIVVTESIMNLGAWVTISTLWPKQSWCTNKKSEAGNKLSIC